VQIDKKLVLETLANRVFPIKLDHLPVKIKSVPCFVKPFIISAYLQLLSPAPLLDDSYFPPLRPIVVLNENAVSVLLLHPESSL
jgi:hypothetical protein